MKIRGIARDLIRALLESAREVDREGEGREFVAVLREEDGVIREFFFLPFTSTQVSASLRYDMMPLDLHVAGSAHSHPSGALRPSDADLRFFPALGRYHLILGPPFSATSWRCFTSDGEPCDLEVVE
ncbi:MAG TPA: Mov34/MPN/PAD-1 family protein [Methanomicrobiales archaeon]|jgi:proteasome lid subunit RPN8/RPN11|nr:Mov34/MPN/PAD-1 family protein [Methanomicrobiales archaeon]